MRHIRSYGLPLLVTFITLSLFIIGFSWLKPGEMDLGGDSSRLYFYDPMSYLKGQSLFSVSPSGFGQENFSYYSLPFFLFLAFLKYFVHSPTTLILLFYGGSLSLAFLFTYFSVRTIIYYPEDLYLKNRATWAALIAGLFYVFSPTSILGWGHNILTFYQVFLNPLIFYLLLKYFLTQRSMYLFIILPITVLFAANFSYVGAPAFFAFYPLSILFIIFYTKIIRNITIRWKDIFIAALLFIGLHAYQLFPIIVSIVKPAGIVHSAIFSQVGKYDRGLNYFNSVAAGVRVTLHWLSLPQLTKVQTIDYAFFIFPLVFVLGFIWNKGKNLLLTGIFFLIALFWVSAKITNLGFAMYAAMFGIPGFSMFRNFFGQWAFFFLFFYVLLVGQSFYLLLKNVNKYMSLLTFTFAILILLVKAWPMINGSMVNTTYWTSNNVKFPFKMDPVYEKVLDTFHHFSEAGKILLFPLADHGYQAIAGVEKNTAYFGPSTISYLTGKQDFASFDEMERYGNLIIRLGRFKNYELLKKTFGLLGIKYIFYNNDPAIYDEAFPGFPYAFARSNFPPDQRGYQELINNLNLKQLFNISNKYYLFQMEDKYVLPEVYTTNNSIYFDNYVTNWMDPLSLNILDDTKPVYFEVLKPMLTTRRYYEALPIYNIELLTKNQQPPLILHNSFASTPPWMLYYPFIVLKEELSMRHYFRKMTDDYFIDRRLFYSAKRVYEIEKFGQGMSVQMISPDPIKLTKTFDHWYTFLTQPYLINSWEWGLVRYFQYMSASIEMVNASQLDDGWKTRQKFLINEYLQQHHIRLVKAIRVSEKSEKERDYLFDLIDSLFYELDRKLQYERFAFDELKYSVNLPESAQMYDILVNNKNFKNNTYDIKIANTTVQGKDFIQEPYWSSYGNELKRIRLSGKQTVTFQDTTYRNLMEDATRLYPENIQNTGSNTLLTVDTSLFRGQNGIFWKLNDWQPDSYYLLSFDYRAPKIPFTLKFYNSDVNSSGVRGYQSILEESLITKNWLHYQAVVKSDNFSDILVLGFTTYPFEYENSQLEIKNLTINQIPLTKILLSQTDDKISVSGPSMSFTKESKVKYKVHVTNANKPYYLILNQWPNSDWKVYLEPKNTSITDDYLLFDRATIADKNHYQVNGDANAWYITPDMTNGATEYDLVIEMTAQRYFYLASIVSIATLIVFIPLFIRSLWPAR